LFYVGFRHFPSFVSDKPFPIEVLADISTG
jgi:hypothetical protein